MKQAVTFDLWNTLIVEGSTGLFAPRVDAWSSILCDAGIDVPRDALDAAHRGALAAYQSSWRAGTPFCSPEATESVLRSLALEVPPPLRDRLVRSFHDAGLESDILPCPNATEVLDGLRQRGMATAVICDIGLTPSSALVPHLQRLDLAPLLDVLTWSDELGCYKPSEAAFDTTLEHLEVDAASAIHVGDRLRTDVAGARAAGMVSVRYRGVFDDTEDLPEADFVIDDLTEVLGLVDTRTAERSRSGPDQSSPGRP